MKKRQTAGNRLPHLIFPRRLRTEAGFGTWSPVTAFADPGRLPWLHWASPSATLDKIKEEHCDDAARRQAISQPIGELIRRTRLEMAIPPGLFASGFLQRSGGAVTASTQAACRVAVDVRRARCPNLSVETRRDSRAHSFGRECWFHAGHRAAVPCCLPLPD